MSRKHKIENYIWGAVDGSTSCSLTCGALESQSCLGPSFAFLPYITTDKAQVLPTTRWTGSNTMMPSLPLRYALLFLVLISPHSFFQVVARPDRDDPTDAKIHVWSHMLLANVEQMDHAQPYIRE